ERQDGGHAWTDVDAYGESSVGCRVPLALQAAVHQELVVAGGQASDEELAVGVGLSALAIDRERDVRERPAVEGEGLSRDRGRPGRSRKRRERSPWRVGPSSAPVAARRAIRDPFL